MWNVGPPANTFNKHIINLTVFILLFYIWDDVRCLQKVFVDTVVESWDNESYWFILILMKHLYTFHKVRLLQVDCAKIIHWDGHFIK